jgi:hypothetical protein
MQPLEATKKKLIKVILKINQKNQNFIERKKKKQIIKIMMKLLILRKAKKIKVVKKNQEKMTQKQIQKIKKK